MLKMPGVKSALWHLTKQFLRWVASIEQQTRHVTQSVSISILNLNTANQYSWIMHAIIRIAIRNSASILLFLFSAQCFSVYSTKNTNLFLVRLHVRDVTVSSVMNYVHNRPGLVDKPKLLCSLNFFRLTSSIYDAFTCKKASTYVQKALIAVADIISLCLLSYWLDLPG